VIPAAVFEAMFVVAWARAEFGGIAFERGRPELTSSHGPSAGLLAAFERARGLIAGAAFALPLRPPARRGEATFVTWPFEVWS
jgi:hypothetical protein